MTIRKQFIIGAIVLVPWLILLFGMKDFRQHKRTEEALANRGSLGYEARLDLRAVQGELFHPDRAERPDAIEVVKARIARNGKLYNAVFAEEYLGANFSVNHQSAAGGTLGRNIIPVLKLTAVSDPQGAFTNAVQAKRQLDNILYIYDVARDKGAILRQIEGRGPGHGPSGKTRVLRMQQERKELIWFIDSLRHKV